MSPSPPRLLVSNNIHKFIFLFFFGSPASLRCHGGERGHHHHPCRSYLMTSICDGILHPPRDVMEASAVVIITALIVVQQLSSSLQGDMITPQPVKEVVRLRGIHVALQISAAMCPAARAWVGPGGRRWPCGPASCAPNSCPSKHRCTGVGI